MPRCQIYKDMRGEWRWRIKSKDGEIKEHSGKGFETKEECQKDGKERGNCTSYQRV